MIRKLLVYTLVAAACLLLAVVLLYLGVWVGLTGPLPKVEELREIRKPLTTTIYASNGQVLGSIFSENRTEVSLSECSPELVHALVATEDARFFEHRGVDLRSLGRVFFKTLLLSTSSAGGGSTISQQLVKNLYPREQYLILTTPVQKIREMIVAYRMESVYTKDEILEKYLNTVAFGELCFGIESASKRFFNKSPGKLTTEEAAVLVGMLKAPTYYSPRRFPERAKTRRNVVLTQMVKYQYLDPVAGDSLQGLPLKIEYTPDRGSSELSRYVIDYVGKSAAELLSGLEVDKPYQIRTDGLKIYTTIDQVVQSNAEDAVRTQMPKLQKRFEEDWGKEQKWVSQDWIRQQAREIQYFKELVAQGYSDEKAMAELVKRTKMTVFSWDVEKQSREFSVLDSLKYYAGLLQMGMYALDPKTGYVKAWIGGIDHRHFQYDHVTSRRQVGSTFKPFVYTAGLENGLELCSYFNNERVVFSDYKDWSPQNASETYGGSYSLQGGLAFSMNTIAVQVLKTAGIDQAIDVARRCGIASPIPKVPSIALGTAELTLQELTGAYAPFANHGMRIAPVLILKIEDRHGNVLYEHEDGPAQRALPDSLSRAMLSCLQMAVDSGTARSLRSVYGLEIPLGGKTGTTQNYTDGWFVGVSPNLVTGVWVGHDLAQVRYRTGAGSGSATAMQVFGQFMRNLVRDHRAGTYVSVSNQPIAEHPGAPACPLRSDLRAEEMEALRSAPEDDFTGIGDFLSSLFAGKEERAEESEQRLLRQMNDKLDRTATRMRKHKKSPTEIRKKLDEIREEYYDRIKKVREKTGEGQ